jgi:16S rRNA (uracil1498-N3)-methyltransferase
MLRVPLDDLRAGERRLDAEASRYLAKVHRLRPGDRFVAFDPAARLEADGELVAAGRAAVVRLSSPRAASNVTTRSIEVIQGLPKGSKIDAIVRDATELGATRITIATTARSLRRAVDVARLERIVIEAARQCGRGDRPILAGLVDLEEALRSAAAAKICLHPAGDARFAAVAGASSVAVLIGSEGGWEESELAAARAAGFSIARLGAFTMRTETACAAALGALAALG